MAEIEDNRLLDFALGLSDDPELKEALRASPELRERFEKIAADLHSLNSELQGSQPEMDRRQLRDGRWRILLAVDETDYSQRAVATAAVLAAVSDGEIIVLHVHEVEHRGLGPPLETPAEATALVSQFVEQLLGQGLRAWGEVRPAPRSEIADEISSAARGTGADLIVMGSRGLSDLGGLLYGSVAHRALRQTPCPVVVVR
jgi:nucleotide-binding universal stress UspA family protein